MLLNIIHPHNQGTVTKRLLKYTKHVIIFIFQFMNLSSIARCLISLYNVWSTHNLEFENYLDQMYPAEREIKDTTKSKTSASYLDLLLSCGRDGQLHISIYDKRDDFNFQITNFPYLSSNIPFSPAYGVFISQFIRYARVCSSYEWFIRRVRWHF